jgi:hypothetical protein
MTVNSNRSDNGKWVLVLRARNRTFTSLAALFTNYNSFGSDQKHDLILVLDDRLENSELRFEPFLNSISIFSPHETYEPASHASGEQAYFFKICIDHLAVCISDAENSGRDFLDWVNSLTELSQPVALSVEEKGLAVTTVRIGGIDLNLVVATKPVAHLRQFLTAHSLGGCFHFGLSVRSMEAAIGFCSAVGVPTIADSIRKVFAGNLSGQEECFHELLSKGYVEESDSNGSLRQTFIFPSKLKSDPSIELVERVNEIGYSLGAAKILLNALDIVLE